jgi:hypothetical protein
MAYVAVSGVVPQFQRNAGGAAANGYFLKAYEGGTTTPLSMGTDSVPTSTLARCRLNSRGEPISNDNDETTVFIPHFDETYRLALYANETDADNNDLNNAVWDVDNISGFFDASQITYRSNATVQQFLDNLQVADYVELRGLTSAQLSDGDAITVTNDGIAGDFVVKTGTVTDNGGTLIVFSDDSNRYAERSNTTPIDPEWFEIGNGDADDSSKWGSLIAWMGDGETVLCGDFTTTITSTVEFTKGVNLICYGTTLIPNIPTSGGEGFQFNADNCHVRGLEVNGSTLTGTLTGNCYGLFGGDGSNKRKNHSYINCKIYNLDRSDGNTGTANLLVTHGIYVDNVDNVKIIDNEFESGTGAAVFIRDITNLEIGHNEITDFVWYPIHLSGGAAGFEIHHNRITSNLVNGIFYGGAIDLMSQHLPQEVRNKDGRVYDNYITGTLSYGSAIRVLSCENVSIEDNTIENVEVGAVSLSPSLTGVRVDTRGTAAGVENGPCRNIHVLRNKIQAGETSGNEFIGIYVSNQWQTARVFAEEIHIRDNVIESIDTTNYWESGILVHGFEGGVERVWIEDNTCVTYMQASPIVNGAIGLVATNAQGEVNAVHIGGNDVRDLGNASSSYQLGIGIGAYVDEIHNSDKNTVDNYFYGVRTFTNAGPIITRFNDQTFLNTGSRTVLEGPVISEYAMNLISASFTDISDIASDVNDQLTYYKFNGMAVRDTTNLRTLYSDGSNANSTWAQSDGTTVVTPS